MTSENVKTKPWPPAVADPNAPLDVHALPDFFDARRAALGKGPSVCAEELRRALEHAAAVPASEHVHAFHDSSGRAGTGIITEHCACGATRSREVRPGAVHVEVADGPWSEPPSATPRVDAGTLADPVLDRCGFITHDEADDMVDRFVASHFNNKEEHARISIPARPERDDDLRLTAYVRQQRELERRARELCSEVATIRECGRYRDVQPYEVAAVVRAGDALAELLETGATKGSSDGKE